MFDIDSFCIIGGDKRQIYLGLSLIKDGRHVVFWGFDKCDMVNNNCADIKQAVKECSAVILPVGLTKDSKTLFAPFSQNTLSLEELFESIHSKIIFCANKDKLNKTGDYSQSKIFDYLEREEFAVLNAVPTAEGAVEIAIKNYPYTINKSKCLITGYGRIGKVLSKLIKAFGAETFVSARNIKDLTWIGLNGYIPVHTESIKELEKYDIIFNTIPSMIFDKEKLMKIRKDTIIIDLASYPGGVDFKSADELGIKAIHALALPGKTAPAAAGEIIKNTVYNMIKEESE